MGERADCFKDGSNLADERRARNRRRHLAFKPDARCYRAKSALVSALQTYGSMDELVGEDRSDRDRVRLVGPNQNLKGAIGRRAAVPTLADPLPPLAGRGEA